MKTKMKALQLPKILRIEGSNSVRFDNSHHLQFQFNVYELVKAVDKLKLHLTDELLKTWADCLELETELNKQATATVQTEQMKALDKQRDDLLTNLFGVVRAQLKSPVQAVRDAAKALDKALGVYTGIQFKAVDAETAEVRGLLKDLERFASEITALGLAPVTAQLKTVNDEFQQTYATRQEKAVERKLPALTEVRPQTDATFAAVCRYIEASYLFATTDEDRTLIERLVDRMNQESEHFKTTHKQSVAQKKAAPKKPGGGKKTTTTIKEQLEKLLPDFEKSQGLAEKSLSYSGHAAKLDAKTPIYLLYIGGDAEKFIWVKIDGKKLVKVNYLAGPGEPGGVQG